MNFTLTEINADLNNVNIRKEGHEDNSTLAVDLKFKVTIDAELLNPLLGNQKTFIESMWNDDGDPRFLGIDTLVFSADFQKHVFKMDGIELKDCKVNQFSADLIYGKQAHLTFRVQAHPDEEQVAALASCMKQQINIDIYSTQNELGLDAPEE